MCAKRWVSLSNNRTNEDNEDNEDEELDDDELEQELLHSSEELSCSTSLSPTTGEPPNLVIVRRA